MTYTLLCETKVDHRHAVSSYGIKLMEGSRCVRVVRDITDNKKKLQALIDDMNRLSLDPMHFDQVLEDFLYGI